MSRLVRRQIHRILSLSLVLPWPGRLLAEPRFIRGDSNGDSRVNLADPVATLFGLFLGAGLGCRDAADSNDDGRLDQSDAIAVLGHLFLGEPPPPAPAEGSCAGFDPTPDPLDCEAGLPEGGDRPGIAFWPEPAPAPGMRQRRGSPLPAPDVYRVGEGVSFALVVEATPARQSEARLVLADPADSSSGNAETLQVVCDRPLGDPAQGGLAAGANLAGLFLRDIDLYRDPIHLLQRAALRIDGRSPMAPSPGLHRFRAQVIDGDCAASLEASFELEVVPSREPEVHLWLEADQDGAASGTPRPASAATGGLLLKPSESVHLIAFAVPNGRAGEGDPAAAIDPSSFRFQAEPPLLAGTDGLTDIAGRFDFEGEAGGGLRWRLPLSLEGGFPLRGNSRLSSRLSTAGGAHAVAGVHALEVEVSYSLDIQPVWTRECTGCHEQPFPEKGLELAGQPPATTYRELVNVYAAEPAIDSSAPLLVWPHRPEASYLLHKLEGTHRGLPVLGSGDQMPLGGPPFLSQADLRLIRDWVLQGAANN